MALLSVIRRWHFREGVSIREISRRSKLSRNTVRKYLFGRQLEPVYPKRTSPSKLDPFAEILSSWLEREATRGRKQRRNLRQLHGDLVALGYPGSYDRVTSFARRWRQRQDEAARLGRGTFVVPLVFSPGEAFQFDWSEDRTVIGGERTKLCVAQFRLCHSRAFVLRAYPSQGHEMLFDAHNVAFEALGGVAHRGIDDNMMTAAGWEKGQMEKQVRDSRPWIWHEMPRFSDLAALNAWLERRCLALSDQIRHPDDPSRTIADVWLEERSYLMAMPPPFDAFVEECQATSSFAHP